MTLDITPYNKQGQQHGYWESYYYTGQLAYKGNYVNGKEHGYFEEYYSNGLLFSKGSYIDGKREGYFIVYQNNSYYKFFYKNSYKYYKNRYVLNFETF